MADPQVSRRNNLPRQLTSFVGREREITDVRRLLSTAYLVTLTGAGGAGKTRLATQVAAGLLEDFRDGVWLVALASVTDPTLVPQTVASILNAPELPGRPLSEILANHLRPKTILLVLDGCEHLQAACARLADALLRVSSNLRILATSRSRLGIEGELSYRIPSLSLPDLRRLTSFESLIQIEAVRLFVERASLSQPGFALTANNARAVAQICNRLDGIPLAIELAALRVNVLSVEQIARRLDDRFRLLTGGTQTGLPRHQTVKATMDWSYDLLSQRERAVLRRLSVFAGGCTLEAAEAVCAGEASEAPGILDLLTQLVDKSLVVAETQAVEARYWLLETVQQYGQDRLSEAGETAATRGRHRDWYLGLAERAAPKLRGPEQGVWLERLEREHDNLRRALDWSNTEDGGAETGLRLAEALAWFWASRSYFSEGRKWLVEALERCRGASPSLRGRALSVAGMLAWLQGDDAAARSLSQESVTIFRELGDKQGLAFATQVFGEAQGDDALKIPFLTQAVAIFREVGDKWHLGLAAFALGSRTARLGDRATARPLLAESLAIFRELRDRLASSNPLRGLGMVAFLEGDHEEARALFEESLLIRRELGGKRAIALALLDLGNVARVQGEHVRMVELFRESLVLFQELGMKRGIGWCLWGLAMASARAEPARAARLFGAREALGAGTGAFASFVGAQESDGKVAAVRAALGHAAFAAAHAQGHAMTLEQAIEYALKPHVADFGKKRQYPSSEDTGPLAPREREVAILVAQGLSNREIATRLVISKRTAQTHVQHILNKLGFTSRTQIATWAVQHGLLPSAE